MQGAFKIRNDPRSMAIAAPVEGLYLIQNTGVLEPISAIDNLMVQKLWLYPGKAVDPVTGALTANGAAINLGKSGTPADLAAGKAYLASGALVLQVTPGRVYRWTKGAADTNMTGDVVLVASGLFTGPASGTVTLNGTPSTAVTCTVKLLRAAPDVIQPADVPLLFEVPLGQVLKLSQVLIQGTAGDGVFYSYT